MENAGKYWILLFLLFGVACSTGKKAPSTPTSGTLRICVDESFKPLLDTEIAVFEDLYPNANIIATYESERACFRELVNDSAMLIVVTRPLNKEEKKYFKSIKIPMEEKPIARDAVALIVNPANDDTTMMMSEVRALMMGDSSAPDYQVVFDKQNSSLVHFVIDSVNGGKPLAKGIKVAGGCKEVVDYVATHKNALGVIGVSWISNPFDSTGLSFLKKINVVSVMGDSTYEYLSKSPTFDPESPDFAEYYFKPYQAYIAFKSYPLTRTVYFVMRKTYYGLNTGFANFLGGNKGQMIIGKNRLFPLNLNIQIRRAEIH